MFSRFRTIVTGLFIAAFFASVPVAKGDLRKKSVLSTSSGTVSSGIVYDSSRRPRQGKWQRPLLSLEDLVSPARATTVIPELMSPELVRKPRFGYGSDWSSDSYERERSSPPSVSSVMQPQSTFTMVVRPPREYYNYRYFGSPFASPFGAPFASPFGFGPQSFCSGPLFSLDFGW